MLLNCGIGEDSWESQGDCKEIQPVHSEGDQPWDFFGRNDAKAEAPVLWSPHVKSWLIGKDSDAGRDWGQEEKGTTEDEMAGWTWVWVNSGRWWWTGRLGVLQSIGSQRFRHSWATEPKCRQVALCHLPLKSTLFFFFPWLGVKSLLNTFYTVRV